MFESIKIAPSDPILGLSKIYNADSRKDKINLGIGVYIDEFGNTPILLSVKKAEEKLLKYETTKNYLNIEGINSFNAATQSLLFEKNNIIPTENIRTVQTPGGTGSLRIAADFIINNTNSRRIWISAPSWINHKNIFLAAGFEVRTYPYYNVITHLIDFDKLYEHLKTNVKNNDVVLFHSCCHNPTGVDPNIDQWNALSELSEKKQWLPLFDLAYQGFSVGLQEDLQGIHVFCKKNIELIICNSYSKNFGLYNERVGACTVVTKNNNIAENALSQLRSIIRANYSNPPAHGASIVSTILHDKLLRSMWENELNCIREHIKHIRELFTYTLQKQNVHKDFSFISKQTGMFCFMGISEAHVTKLREQSGIYLVGSGRINLSGLSHNNIVRVSEILAKIYTNNHHEINIT